MLPSAPEMHTRTDLYHGLFRWRSGQNGQPTVSRHESGPALIPCPTTGRPLRVATLDAEAAAICPRCAHHGQGGFVSFVADLRMAYACPQCLELVWLAGA
jgi:uncharacterized paraquat-inducible protein A